VARRGAGTVARGHLEPRRPSIRESGDTLAETLPVPLTREILERGRERYEIFCTPCTAAWAQARRRDQAGHASAPSYHIPRLRRRRSATFSTS